MKVIVPGKPIPKGRPRVVNGRAHTPKKTRDYETRVRNAIRASMEFPLAVAPVKVSILLVFPNMVHGDLDNCAKALTDAANGLLYADDKQIAELHVRREYDSENPRAEMTVEAL